MKFVEREEREECTVRIIPFPELSERINTICSITYTRYAALSFLREKNNLSFYLSHNQLQRGKDGSPTARGVR